MLILLKTLGCKSNRYESDRLFERLSKLGHKVVEVNEGTRSFVLGDLREHDRKIDIYIVNTCTVTQVADRKSRQAIFGFKSVNSDGVVIIFGCGSNVDKNDYNKLKGVDFVAKDASEVLKIIKKIDAEKSEHSKRISCDNFIPLEDSSMRTRALVKIQDGCNNFCSYCIIPRARGREVSFTVENILADVKRLEKQGYKEIVLTGINIGEWRGDKEMNIADLIETLIENTKTVRFRISSIEPKNFSAKFFKLFKTGRLCPHIHVCLQSGSDSILKRMRRNYLTKEFADLCAKFRKSVPEIGITTDVIVGFPGETEKEFTETCKFVKKIGFLKVHVFPYSKRKNTPAYYMENQIQESVKKLRAEKLRKISETAATKFKKTLLGKTYEILVEKPKGNLYHGFTPNYASVQFLYSERSVIVNTVLKLRLSKLLKNGDFEGEIV